MKNTDSVTIATAIAEEFITRYGCPRVIQSDQGSNLVSKVIKIFCKNLKVQKDPIYCISSTKVRVPRKKSSYFNQIS